MHPPSPTPRPSMQVVTLFILANYSRPLYRDGGPSAEVGIISQVDLFLFINGFPKLRECLKKSKKDKNDAGKQASKSKKRRVHADNWGSFQKEKEKQNFGHLPKLSSLLISK